MLKHCFLYCTMNEFTAIMKKISVSGIKSADLRIRIAKKTHDPPPLSIVWKVNDPPICIHQKPVTPLYSATPPPPPLKFMNSPLVSSGRSRFSAGSTTDVDSNWAWPDLDDSRPTLWMPVESVLFLHFSFLLGLSLTSEMMCLLQHRHWQLVIRDPLCILVYSARGGVGRVRQRAAPNTLSRRLCNSGSRSQLSLTAVSVLLLKLTRNSISRDFNHVIPKMYNHRGQVSSFTFRKRSRRCQISVFYSTGGFHPPAVLQWRVRCMEVGAGRRWPRNPQRPG